MRQRASPAFHDERRRFALRFTCEHCTYFHVEEQRCMHGYPNRDHRAARYESSPHARVADLLFCKEFELV